MRKHETPPVHERPGQGSDPSLALRFPSVLQPLLVPRDRPVLVVVALLGPLLEQWVLAQQVLALRPTGWVALPSGLPDYA